MSRLLLAAPSEEGREQNLTRREATRALLAFFLVGCGSSSGARAQIASGRESVFQTGPLVNSLPAAGLTWFVQTRPATLSTVPEVWSELSRLFPEENVLRTREAYGGIDPRTLEDLLVADYGETRLYAGRGYVEPARIERAFREAALDVEARAVDATNPNVVRTFGNVGSARGQVITFGHEVVALEIGKLGPARAFEAFALHRLKRAVPALAAPPLAQIAARLDAKPSAPATLLARAFARGPFRGAWKNGLGGLLESSRGLGVSLEQRGDRTHVTLVLDAALGEDAGEANRETKPARVAPPEVLAAYEGRLRAALETLLTSPLGRLMGLDHTKGETSTEPPFLVWTASVGTKAALSGLYDAVAGNASEIMKHVPVQ